ncbi:MAG: type II toxin-antitoxin system Phd/YefM family antitoxin [Thermomicrobiales bacterium]
MEKRLSATEARVHFGEVLKRVAEDGSTYVIERAGKPQAVIISDMEYRRLTQNASPRRLMEKLAGLQEVLGSEAEERARFDWEELIREEREKRAQQIEDAVHGR